MPASMTARNWRIETSFHDCKSLLTEIIAVGSGNFVHLSTRSLDGCRGRQLAQGGDQATEVRRLPRPLQGDPPIFANIW